MSDATILARIESWLADGVIDAPTAARLREAEGRAGDGEPARGRRGDTASTLFGPSIRVGEMFAYVGGGFLLAACYALIGRLASESAVGDALWAVGLFVIAVAVGVGGFRIRDGSPRFRRAAGVAFLASAAHLGGAAYALVIELANPDTVEPVASNDVAPALAGAAAALIGALVYRRLHPALLTQVGLVGAVVVSAAAVMRWLESILFGARSFDVMEPPVESPAKVVLIGIGWGLTAIVLGVLGLRESRSRMPGSEARAALTRFAAGMTAVLGTASAVLATGYLGGDEYGRLIPPVVGDAILIAVSAVLLERAFRRQASAFVYPAALGVIIGLSDLNATYLAAATTSELALLVEGAILLAAGFAFDRLRRRVGGTGEPPPASAQPIPDPGSA